MRRISVLLLALILSSCNYNYWTGKDLEEEGRIEEANIEYHRALTYSPGDDDFREAFDRTAIKTSLDLLERYRNFLYLGKFRIAYDRLSKARSLNPENQEIKAELGKWTHVLLAGKLDLSFKSLKHQVPLSDEMEIQVMLNSPNPNEVLTARVNPQNSTFAVEDQIYNANIQYLMSYSFNAIGIKLVRKNPTREHFQKFVDFRKPVITGVKGGLKSTGGSKLKKVVKLFPLQILKRNNKTRDWVPRPAVEYNARLAGDRIVIGKVKNIAFLPQMMYLNQQEKRILLDFGQVEVRQKKFGGLWRFRRKVNQDRSYLDDIQKNILLKPFFYYREGGFPFVKS